MKYRLFALFLIPVRKAYVGRFGKAVKLSSGNGLQFIFQFCILLKRIPHLIRIVICDDSADGSVIMVEPGEDPHAYKVHPSQQAVTYELIQSILIFLRTLLFYRKIPFRYALSFLDHKSCFIIRLGPVDLCAHMLGPSVMDEPAALQLKFRHFAYRIFIKSMAELLLHPLMHVGLSGIRAAPAPSVKIVSQIQEIGKRHFLKSEIAHIYDPKLLYAVLICSAHLLPHLGQIGGIDPLKGDRIAMIIKMIIHAEAAGMLPHLFIGNTP